MKRIYSSGTGHSYFRGVLKNFPKEFELIVNDDIEKSKKIIKLRKNKFIAFLYKSIIKKIISPIYILDKVLNKKSPDNIDLIFSFGLVTEKKPWVVEIIDNPMLFAGYDYKLFLKNLPKIEKILASPYCKKILVHTNDCKKQFEKYFSENVNKKILLFPPGIENLPIKRIKRKDKNVQFIFIGSVNNPGDFFIKGGLETLETFKELSKKYKNIRLLMACEPPEDIKQRYTQDNIVFLGEKIPYEKIKELYLESDIFILPGHSFFIMAFLEATSFGLPIIALDTYGSADYISNNKNGFLIKPSDKIKGYKDPSYPCNFRSKEFIQDIKNLDREVITRLVEKAEVLIKNTKLRKKMGEESLRLARTKFSFEKRNKKLKKILDEAMQESS